MKYKKIFVPGPQSFPWRTLLVLGFVVFFVRLLLSPFLSPYSGNPEGALKVDAWGSIARNVAEGHGYVAGEIPTPTAYRVPVTVLWFAGIFVLFGYKLWPVMIGNWLLDVGTAVVLFQLARYIFPQKRSVAVLSVLMYAFYAPAMWVSYAAYAESLFTLLLMLHLLTLVHLLNRPSLGRAAMGGLWLGLAALSRTVLLAFPAIILGLMLLRYRRLGQVVKHFGMLGIVFVVVLSPWIIRNYLTFEAFIPGNTGFGFGLIKNHYYLTSDDYLRELAPAKVLNAEMERLLNTRGDSLANYNAANRDKLYVREALARIAQRLDRYLVLSVNRLSYLWFYLDFVERYNTQKLSVLAATAISLIWERRVRASQTMPLWAIILYVTLFHMLIHSQPRYTVPVMPAVMLLAAPTIHKGLTKVWILWSKATNQRKKMPCA
jgi:4-amino-4-deoxy-L-arabinose transferase-like glycosyltransferase